MGATSQHHLVADVEHLDATMEHEPRYVAVLCPLVGCSFGRSLVGCSFGRSLVGCSYGCSLVGFSLLWSLEAHFWYLDGFQCHLVAYFHHHHLFPHLLNRSKFSKIS